MNFTQGEWSCEAAKCNDQNMSSIFSTERASDGMRKCVAVLIGSRLNLLESEERNANAKLIAAAPELLEALQFCKSVLEAQGLFDLSEQQAFDKAKAAISKAIET